MAPFVVTTATRRETSAQCTLAFIKKLVRAQMPQVGGKARVVQAHPISDGRQPRFSLNSLPPRLATLIRFQKRCTEARNATSHFISLRQAKRVEGQKASLAPPRPARFAGVAADRSDRVAHHNALDGDQEKRCLDFIINITKQRHT